MEEDWLSANHLGNFPRQKKVLCMWSKMHCIFTLWGRSRVNDLIGHMWPTTTKRTISCQNTFWETVHWICHKSIENNRIFKWNTDLSRAKLRSNVTSDISFYSSSIFSINIITNLKTYFLALAAGFVRAGHIYWMWY